MLNNISIVFFINFLHVFATILKLEFFTNMFKCGSGSIYLIRDLFKLWSTDQWVVKKFTVL